MHASLLSLLLACQPEPEPTSPEPTQDSELVVTEYDPDLPEYDRELDLEGATQAVQTAIDNMRVITAHDTRTYYDEVWDLRADVCPKEAVGIDEWGVVSYWDGVCRTPEGVWYNGPMTIWTFEDVNLAEGYRLIFGYHFEPDAYQWTGWGMQGQTDVVDEALTFDYNCSCTGLLAEGVHEDGSTAYRQMINGPTHYDKEGKGESWTDLGINSETQVTYYLDGDGDEVEVQSYGSYTLMHPRYDTVQFRIKAVWSREGQTCRRLTAGAISVRDAVTGYVAEGTLDNTQGCDWCVQEGELDGLCVDGTSLFDWEEERPW